MKSASKKAVTAFRKRARQAGLARYEIMCRKDDRPLLQAVARKLSAGGSEEKALRGQLAEILPIEAETRGRIYEALRASPLAGSGISLVRERSAGRKVRL